MEYVIQDVPPYGRNLLLVVDAAGYVRISADTFVVIN